MAYCNSNTVMERETLFNQIASKINNDTCHSYGRCCGNLPQTQKKTIGGGWSGDEIIDIYKDYTFVIAMENICVDGYVTEKY